MTPEYRVFDSSLDKGCVAGVAHLVRVPPRRRRPAAWPAPRRCRTDQSAAQRAPRPRPSPRPPTHARPTAPRLA